jgi:WD40 repeat protein
MASKAKKSMQSHTTRPAPARKPASKKDVRVRVFEGHNDTVYRVAMPADGRFALTSSDDGTVRKWGLETDDAKSEIVCNGKPFIGLAVTADGRRAASGDGKGTIHLIDLHAARELRKWQGHKYVVGNLAFLAEGRELLSAAEDGYLRRWDANSGAEIAHCKLPFDGLFGVAASSDSTRIVGAAVADGLALWPAHRGEKPVIFRENIASGSPVCISADGRFAFTGTQDGKVAQWDLTAGRRIAAFEGHSGNVCGVAVTPDGRICVSCGDDGSVRLWAAETGQCLAILRGHTDLVYGVAIAADARRIASVSGDHTLRVWDIPEAILARAATPRKRGYMNAKVVLLGESRVGKTGLALRLWHDDWRVTDSTHGMEIRRIVLPGSNAEPDVEREIWLWDLAGQQEYRLTHRLFMERTSLVVIVVDRQRDDMFSSAKYWQEALRKVTSQGAPPCILVAGRCDEPGQKWTAEEMKQWAERHGIQGPILTAAKVKKHPGATELRELIAKLIPWDTIEFRSTMENFPALKDAILAVRDAKDAGGVVVKPGELEARVRQAAPNLLFTAEDLRAVTGLLAGEGVLHALPYGDFVVLQPSWVNCYASTLVKLAGEAENQLGHVPLATIQPGHLPVDGTRRLTLEDEQQLLPALVALFLERGLAWKQDTDKGPMLVFPNYVRLPRTEPPPRPGRTVLYRFSGPLEEIYCTLVVRLHYSGLFAKTRLYRQAADFHTATGKLAALTMREEGERGELEIYFGEGLNPDLQASFQQFVHDHLELKATGLERLRNFFCPKCKEEVTDRKVIDAALAKKRTKIVCAYCDPDDRPGMIDLNDVLEQQLASKAGEEGADQAGRKASEEIVAASKEGVMVGEVQTIVFNADQIYRTVGEPDEGVDGEIEFRNARKKATGITYRVQLKSGDSHLRKRKGGVEVFAMKDHYEELWAREGTVPVLLIIRTGDGRTRYMNATDAIRAAQKANPGKPVKQMVFAGEDFTKEAVLRLRDERMK